MPSRLAPRHPLGWGMTMWGPLPDTADMWILWSGPGDGLELFVGNPGKQGAIGKRIRHLAAGDIYLTVAEAEKAVNAFIQAGLDQEEKS